MNARRGRQRTDSGLLELAAYLAVCDIELDRLNAEREQLANSDRQAFLYNRHSVNEYSNRWWCCVEKIIAMPATGMPGLRVKSNTLTLIQRMRDESNSLTDTAMCNNGFRLALSLANDVLRWKGRVP
jgi:hypothetical protein